MNACIRFKLGLTEDNPSIKAYDQDAWGKPARIRPDTVNVSVTLLHALHFHAGWLCCSRFPAEQWQRTLYHPEIKQMTLWYLLGPVPGMDVIMWHISGHYANRMTEPTV